MPVVPAVASCIESCRGSLEALAEATSKAVAVLFRPDRPTDCLLLGPADFLFAWPTTAEVLPADVLAWTPCSAIPFAILFF